MPSGTIGRGRWSTSALSATITPPSTSSSPPSAARWRSRMPPLALLLAAPLVAGCGDAKSSQPGKSAAPPGAAVNPGTMVHHEHRTRTTLLETTAKVQFNEEQLVRINAPVTGRVVEVLARPGEVVEPGHP